MCCRVAEVYTCGNGALMICLVTVFSMDLSGILRRFRRIRNSEVARKDERESPHKRVDAPTPRRENPRILSRFVRNFFYLSHTHACFSFIFIYLFFYPTLTFAPSSLPPFLFPSLILSFIFSSPLFFFSSSHRHFFNAPHTFCYIVASIYSYSHPPPP